MLEKNSIPFGKIDYLQLIKGTTLTFSLKPSFLQIQLKLMYMAYFFVINSKITLKISQTQYLMVNKTISFKSIKFYSN